MISWLLEELRVGVVQVHRCVADVIKRRAAAVGLDGSLPGHSLRSVFATEKIGVSCPRRKLVAAAAEAGATGAMHNLGLLLKEGASWLRRKLQVPVIAIELR